MRDEMDARMWNEHHEQFTRSIDNGLAALGSALSAGTAAASNALLGRLLAAGGAFGLTLMTLGGTAA